MQYTDCHRINSGLIYSARAYSPPHTLLSQFVLRFTFWRKFYHFPCPTKSIKFLQISTSTDLKEYFNSVDKKEDDNNKHESGIAAIEDMSVVLNILHKNSRNEYIYKHPTQTLAYECRARNLKEYR